MFHVHRLQWQVLPSYYPLDAKGVLALAGNRYCSILLYKSSASSPRLALAGSRYYSIC